MSAIREIATRARRASETFQDAFSNEPKSMTARTTPHKYALTRKRLPFVLLPLLAATAAYALFYVGHKNGLLPMIDGILADGEAKYPGQEGLLQRNYTGVKAVDHMLATLILMFSPVADAITRGDHDMALFALFGLGQFGAGWTLMFMESLRHGNQGRLVSYITVYGMFVQTCSFAVATPIYLWLHLMFSPVATPFPSAHASSVLMVSPADLAILPFSSAIGYLVPSLLLMLPAPSIVSWVTHQRLIALWQPFPVITIVAHLVLRRVYSTLFAPGAQKATVARGPVHPSTTYLTGAGKVYAYTLVLCIVTHIPVLAMCLIPGHLIPVDTMPHLAKMTQSTLTSVFLPYAPTIGRTFTTLAPAVKNFLQWDVYLSSASALVWGVVMYRHASVEREVVDPTTSLPIYRELLSGERFPDQHLARNMVAKIVLWTLFTGPFGALTILLWQRDAIVKQKVKQGI